MKKLFLFSLCLFLLFSTACGRSEQAALLLQLDEEMPYLLEYFPEYLLDTHMQDAILHFTEQLFVKLLETDEKNPSFSPFASYFSLALASLGAHEDTRLAFRELLGAEPAALAVSLHDLQSIWGKSSYNPARYLAATLCLDDTFPLADDFSNWVQTYFHSQPAHFDFADTELQAYKTNWFSRLFPHLPETAFLSSEFTPNSASLLSALPVSFSFDDAISPVSLTQSSFTTTNNEVREIPFLTTSATTLKVLQNETLHAVSLPFAADNIGFLLIAPATPEIPLRQWIADVSIADVLHLLSDTEDVSVTLPAFDVLFSTDFSSILQSMGLDIAFDPQFANLSGMIAKEDADDILHLSAVLQTTHFTLDETGVHSNPPALSDTLADNTPFADATLHFHFPFLYLIYDFYHHIPLIMGVFEG